MKFLNIKLDKQNKFELTPEGFIKTKAYLTRVGVFDYYEDGVKIRNLRPKSEVFDADSLKTLEMKPLTFNHPEEMVKNTNIANYQVGTIGEDIQTIETDKGSFVEATVVITHKDAVQYVLNKHKMGEAIELSCGYTVQEDKTPGMDDKEGKYDVIQRNIRYNHVSIVPEGRAGKEVKLLLDSKHNNNNGENEMGKPNKEGDTPQVNENEVKIDSLNKELETIKADAKKKEDEMTAKLDALETKNKELKDELSKWQNPESDEVKNMLDAKQKVLDIAREFKLDCEGKSTNELKLECIKKTDADFTEEGKSEDYINARFDACKLFLDVEKDNKQKIELAMLNKKDSEDKKPEPKKELSDYSKEKRNEK